MNSSRGGGGRHLGGGPKFCTLRGRGDEQQRAFQVKDYEVSSVILEWGSKYLYKSERGTKIPSDIS